ncbi:MAG: hypothetical protein ABII27_03850 [bacterium]
MLFKLFHAKFKEGISLLKKGELDKAKEVFLGILKNNPKDADAVLELSRIHFKQNDITRTKEYLLKLLDLDSSPKMKKSILEITNWRLISSNKYYNHPPSFSRDGRWLVYASVRTDTNGDGIINSLDNTGLYLYEFAKNKEYRVVDDKFHNTYPTLSPDGNKLLYISARSSDSQTGLIDRHKGNVYLADLQSSKEEQLPITGTVKFPSFSPDGEKITYSCWKEGADRSDIYYYDLKEKKEHPVTAGLFESTFPQFSPDSKRIVYSSWRQDTDGDGIIGIRDFSSIVLVDIDTLREIIISADLCDDSYPGFSFDGKHIVFLNRKRDTNKDGKIDSLDNANILVYSTKNKVRSMLVKDNFYNKFPCFSYDSKNIIFLSSWRKYTLFSYTHEDYFNNKGIYKVDLASRNVINIVNEKYYGCRYTAVSPTEPKVAYLSWHQASSRGIYMADYERLPDVNELKSYIENNLQ